MQVYPALMTFPNTSHPQVILSCGQLGESYESAVAHLVAATEEVDGLWFGWEFTILDAPRPVKS